MQQKIYDGQPGELNAQHFELIFTDGSHIILEDSDLAFADGIAPIVVGRYAVTLSASVSKRCCQIICLKMSIPSKRSLKSLRNQGRFLIQVLVQIPALAQIPVRVLVMRQAKCRVLLVDLVSQLISKHL